MIDLLSSLRAHAAYGPRLMGFLPALLVAELFYRFHSFALDCIGFLVTWLLLDLLIETIVGAPTPGLPNRTRNAESLK